MKIVEENGGICLPDMDSGTQAILPNFKEPFLELEGTDWFSLLSEPEVNAVKNSYLSGVVLTAQWLLDSEKAGMLLDKAQYAYSLSESIRSPFSLKCDTPKLTLLDLIQVKKLIHFCT